MRVLWDPQIFTWQQHGGVSRVFAELYGAFARHNHGIKLTMPPWYGNNVYADAVQMPQQDLLPWLKLRSRKAVIRMLNRRSLAREIRHTKPALIHPTFFEPGFLQFANDTPFILTVHDMIHERYANTRLAASEVLLAKKQQLLQRAVRIIAVSEATKQDIVDFCAIDPDRIDVVYHGNRLQPINPVDGAATRYLQQPYLLYIGQRGTHKNFERCLRAIAPVLEQRDLRLLCVGGGPWLASETEQIQSLRLTERVTQLSLADQNLAEAYQQAEMLVFPSLYEGFGLPLLEAFACGCPVVASDVAPIREIAGDAALLFDPLQEEAIAAAMEQLLDDDDLRLRLCAAGSERVRAFAWDNTAKETAASYRRAAAAID